MMTANPLSIASVALSVAEALASPLRKGAILTYTDGTFILAQNNAEIARGTDLIGLAALLRLLDGKASVRCVFFCKASRALTRGIAATRWHGETLSAFLRVAITNEIARREALIKAEVANA